MSSVYDPLRLVAPLLLPAKKVLQELCKSQFGWDELIPQENFPVWKQWLCHLTDLKNVTASCCLKPENFGKLQAADLHHFSDASESGYGACFVWKTHLEIYIVLCC